MKAKPADGDDYTYIYPQRREGVQIAKATPVTPYTEPKIAANIALTERVTDLRQQVKDLQSTQQALIVAMLKTEDGVDDDDTDF